MSNRLRGRMKHAIEAFHVRKLIRMPVTITLERAYLAFGIWIHLRTASASQDPSPRRNISGCDSCAVSSGPMDGWYLQQSAGENSPKYGTYD